MKIEIFGKDYNVSDSLKAITEKKCAKLDPEASSDSPFDNIDLVIPRLLGQHRKQKDIWGKSKRGSENVYEEEEEV